MNCEKRFLEWLDGRKKQTQVSNADLAGLLHTNKYVMDEKIEHCRFELKDLIALFRVFDVTKEELVYIFK